MKDIPFAVTIISAIIAVVICIFLISNCQINFDYMKHGYEQVYEENTNRVIWKKIEGWKESNE